ncbi:MAG: hypothetical protein LBR73_02525 [Oscillospiraceae bacterium]|jgi:hypothetical protein|nr:hypothetical protein [Oscillospiraceae bacterium]
MKTLLIYHTNKQTVRRKCQSLACGDVDVLEITPRYKKRFLIDSIGDCYRAFAGRGTRVLPMEIDWSEYTDVTVIATLNGGRPTPECNEFFFQNDLGGRKVNCIIVSNRQNAGRAGTLLRRRIRLAGGDSSSVTYMNEHLFCADGAEREIVHAAAAAKA